MSCRLPESVRSGECYRPQAPQKRAFRPIKRTAVARPQAQPNPNPGFNPLRRQASATSLQQPAAHLTAQSNAHLAKGSAQLGPAGTSPTLLTALPTIQSSVVGRVDSIPHVCHSATEADHTILQSSTPDLIHGDSSEEEETPLPSPALTAEFFSVTSNTKFKLPTPRFYSTPVVESLLPHQGPALCYRAASDEPEFPPAPGHNGHQLGLYWQAQPPRYNPASLSYGEQPSSHSLPAKAEQKPDTAVKPPTSSPTHTKRCTPPPPSPTLRKHTTTAPVRSATTSALLPARKKAPTVFSSHPFGPVTRVRSTSAPVQVPPFHSPAISSVKWQHLLPHQIEQRQQRKKVREKRRREEEEVDELDSDS